MKTVLTYGTFDLFHVGHLRMLQRLRALGDRLIVGVSTTAFNRDKGKHSVIEYEERSEIVAALSCVDLVIAETDWSQKQDDIRRYSVDIFGIGDDWEGEFDYLQSFCTVVYLPRTPNISSTYLRKATPTIESEASYATECRVGDAYPKKTTVK